MVKDNGPLLTAELLEVAGLHVAQDLEAHGFEVVKEAGQLQAGPADIVHRDVDFLKVFRLVQGDQIKFLYQSCERDAINMLQKSHLVDIIPAFPHLRNGVKIFRPFANFSLHFLWISAMILKRFQAHSKNL